MLVSPRPLKTQMLLKENNVEELKANTYKPEDATPLVDFVDTMVVNYFRGQATKHDGNESITFGC